MVQTPSPLLIITPYAKITQPPIRFTDPFELQLQSLKLVCKAKVKKKCLKQQSRQGTLGNRPLSACCLRVRLVTLLQLAS